MKKGLEIKKLSTMPPVIGLALMLLLSPCKLRNFIQSELGVQQTEVSNKSKTAISQTKCQTFEVADINQSVSKVNILHPNLIAPDVLEFGEATILLKRNFNEQVSRKPQFSHIPLYILYQNLLVYS